MKKGIIAFTIIMLANVTAFAQGSFDDSPNNKVYLGIRAGASLVSPGSIYIDDVGVDALSDGAGWDAGLIFNIPIVANFYIEPGVKFFYGSYSLDSKFVEDIDKLEGLVEKFVPKLDLEMLESVKIKMYGLRVPVMAGYHFDFNRNWKLHVFTGPEFEAVISGKQYVKSQGMEVKTDVYGDEGHLRRYDLNWVVGAGVEYRHLFLSVQGGFGMLNMVSAPHVKLHENRGTVTLGYNF